MAVPLAKEKLKLVLKVWLLAKLDKRNCCEGLKVARHVVQKQSRPLAEYRPNKAVALIDAVRVPRQIIPYC